LVLKYPTLDWKMINQQLNSPKLTKNPHLSNITWEKSVMQKISLMAIEVIIIIALGLEDCRMDNNLNCNLVCKQFLSHSPTGLPNNYSSPK
jgi:hypothetical protein